MRIGSKYVPLAALQGFEAAARHLNMGRAAEELGLTQSAISHQVRAVERALDVRLFEDNRRRLQLTVEGRHFMEAVRQALEGISAAAFQIGAEEYSGSLSVAAPPALVARWLSPRLPRFLELFPKLDLRVQGIVSGAEARLPRVDAAITFNSVNHPGMQVEILAELEMFPVCAPGVLPPDWVGDLVGQTLIHEDDGTIWARWSAARGIVQRATRNVFVPTTRDALALARAGGGLAMDDLLMSDKDARLMRPFGAAAMSFGQYALVTASADRLSPAAAAFADWLRREMAAGAG